MLRQQPRPGLLAGLPCRHLPLGSTPCLPPGSSCLRHVYSPCSHHARSSVSCNAASGKASASGNNKGRCGIVPKGKGFGAPVTPGSSARRRRHHQHHQQQQQMGVPDNASGRGPSQGVVAAASSSMGRSEDDNAPSEGQQGPRSESAATSPGEWIRDHADTRAAAVPQSPAPKSPTEEPPATPEPGPPTPPTTPSSPELPDSRPDTPDSRPDSPFETEPPAPAEPWAGLTGPRRDRSDEQAGGAEEAKPLRPQSLSQGFVLGPTGFEIEAIPGPQGNPDPESPQGQEGEEAQGSSEGRFERWVTAGQGDRDQEGMDAQSTDSASLQAVPTAAVLLDRPTAVQDAGSTGRDTTDQDSMRSSSSSSTSSSSSSDSTASASSGSSKGKYSKMGSQPGSQTQGEQVRRRPRSDEESAAAADAATAAAAATEQLLQDVKSRVGPFKESTGLDSAAFLKGLNEPAINSLKSLDAAERVRKGEGGPQGQGPVTQSGPQAEVTQAGSTNGLNQQQGSMSGAAAAAGRGDIGAGAEPGLGAELEMTADAASDATTTAAATAAAPAGEDTSDSSMQQGSTTGAAAAADLGDIGAGAEPGLGAELEMTADTSSDTTTAAPAAAAAGEGPSDSSIKPSSTPQPLPTASLSEDFHTISETAGAAATGAALRAPPAGGIRAFEISTGRLSPSRLQHLQEAAGEVQAPGSSTRSSTPDSSTSSSTGSSTPGSSTRSSTPDGSTQGSSTRGSTRRKGSAAGTNMKLNRPVRPPKAVSDITNAPDHPKVAPAGPTAKSAPAAAAAGGLPVMGIALGKAKAKPLQQIEEVAGGVPVAGIGSGSNSGISSSSTLIAPGIHTPPTPASPTPAESDSEATAAAGSAKNQPTDATGQPVSGLPTASLSEDLQMMSETAGAAASGASPRAPPAGGLRAFELATGSVNAQRLSELEQAAGEVSKTGIDSPSSSSGERSPDTSATAATASGADSSTAASEASAAAAVPEIPTDATGQPVSGLPTASLSEDFHMMSETAGAAATGAALRAPPAGGIRAFEVATGSVNPKRLQKLQEAAGEVPEAGTTTTSSSSTAGAAAAAGLGDIGAGAEPGLGAELEMTAGLDAGDSGSSRSKHSKSKPSAAPAAAAEANVLAGMAGSALLKDIGAGAEPGMVQEQEMLPQAAAVGETGPSSSTDSGIQISQLEADASAAADATASQQVPTGVKAAADTAASASKQAVDAVADASKVAAAKGQEIAQQAASAAAATADHVAGHTVAGAQIVASGTAAAAGQVADAAVTGGKQAAAVGQGAAGYMAEGGKVAAGAVADATTAVGNAAVESGKGVAAVGQQAAAYMVEGGKVAAGAVAGASTAAGSAAVAGVKQTAAVGQQAAAYMVEGGKVAAGAVAGASTAAGSAAVAGGKQAAAYMVEGGKVVADVSTAAGSAAVAGGKQAAAYMVEGGKVAAGAVADVGTAAGGATVQAAKVGGGWLAAAGMAAAQGVDALAIFMRRTWTLVFRLTKLSTLLLLEASRRVMAIVAGLLSAVTHRVLLMTAHPAEVEHAVTTLAGPGSTPHHVPADTLPRVGVTPPLTPAAAADSATAGLVNTQLSMPTEASTAVPTDAPGVLSSILEEESSLRASGRSKGRVLSVKLAGKVLQASSADPSTAQQGDTPAVTDSVDIKDISRVWGISELVSSPEGGPAITQQSASNTSAPAADSTSSNADSLQQASALAQELRPDELGAMSMDISSIGNLWGLGGTPQPSAPDSSSTTGATTPGSALGTGAQGSSSSASGGASERHAKPHKKVDLSDSMAHVMPAVPDPDTTAGKPGGPLESLAASAVNAIGMEHVKNINIASASVRTIRHAVADTPAGAAVSDAAGAVQHAAQQAASAAGAATQPGEWAEGAKVVLGDIQAMVAPPAPHTSWEAPEEESDPDSSSSTGAPPDPWQTSTPSSTSSSAVGDFSSAGDFRPSAAAASGTGGTTGTFETSTGHKGAFVHASTPAGVFSRSAPSAPSANLGQPQATEALAGAHTGATGDAAETTAAAHAAPGTYSLMDTGDNDTEGHMLAYVHELLHELLRLEDQMEQQLKRVHDVQHRLNQALAMQQQQQKAQGTDASAAAAGEADLDANASVDQLDSSGISMVLLGDLTSELKQAERQLQQLEADAASILVQMVSVVPPAAAATAAENLAEATAIDSADAAQSLGGSSSIRKASGASRLHGDRAALGLQTGSNGSNGSSSGMSERASRRKSSSDRQALAQQLLAAGSVGLLGDKELNALLKQVAQGEGSDIAGHSRGFFSSMFKSGGSGTGGGGGGGGGGGSGGGRGGGGGGGGGRRRTGGSGGDDHSHSGHAKGFLHWLTHMRAKHAAKILFQLWLGSVVLLGTFWYAYQLLYKMPMEEFKTMTHTAKHVAEAGAGVAKGTANVAGAVAHAVGVGSSHKAEETGFGWGRLGGFVKGLGSSTKSLARQPLKVANSAATASFNGSKKLYRLLVGGSGSTSGSTSTGFFDSTSTAGDQEPSAAAVAAARVGVGALLVLLASKTAGSGDSSSKKTGSTPGGSGRTARAPSSGYDLGLGRYNRTAGYRTTGSKAAAAKAKATDVAHSLADQSVSLANALSAMPSWFLSNIKTVAGGNGHGHYKGANSSSGGSRTATNGRGGKPASAAAPAGVMGFDDGVLYSVPGSNWGGAGPSSTASKKHQRPGVSGAAVWGPQGSALLAPGGSGVVSDAAGAGVRRGGGGRDQKRGVPQLSDAEQQQLQVLYRSLSNVPGSWH